MSSRNSRFCSSFSVQEPYRNPQPHLNSQSIFFFFLTAPAVSTRRGAPQVHPDETVALRARCTPVFTSKRLKNMKNVKTVQCEYPVGRSHPVPLAAPRGSLPGLSLRSNSSLQTGFSLRSAGRAVTSTPTSGQSDTHRKNPR